MTDCLRSFGLVKSRVAAPWAALNLISVRDCQLHHITKFYMDAQNRLLWRDKTCLART